MKPRKAMGLDDRLAPLFENEARCIKTAQRLIMFSSAALHSFQEPLLMLFLAIVVYVALEDGSFSFATLAFMAVLFQRIVARTGGLQVQYHKMAGFESAYWSIRNAINEAASEHEVIVSEGKNPSLKKGIRFENVNFAYDETHVLKGISLNVPAKAFTAIVGTSGAGKTTLVDLVIGLIEPLDGIITIDDVPLRGINRKAWRRGIGYVPQELVLLHDTIAGNIALGDPSITREDIENALRAAGALDFVNKLPEGLDTTAGERGVRLSGGQRQRIAIARALVSKPLLLLLDEPTTALDPDTAQEICATLCKLSGQTTILAISHQNALVEVADQVYRIEQGRLAENEAGHP